MRALIISILSGLLACLPTAGANESAAMHGKEMVVFLHGIGHARPNMHFIEKAFKKQGYKTLNKTYPSVKHEIKALSKWLNDMLEEKQIWEDYDKVHFVSHSMGGLVTGFYLQEYKEDIPVTKLGRVVMLGTPHGGSEVADGLQDFWLYKLIFGPAGQQLTTEARKDEKLKPDYELGIIAGTKHWMYPFGMYFIKGEHDGCVSVKSTRLEGMKDHIILPVLHGVMGFNSKIHKQALHFIEHGEFNHAG